MMAGNGILANDGTSLVASITAVAAPEPSSLVALAGLGLAGLVGLVRYPPPSRLIYSLKSRVRSKRLENLQCCE